MRLRRKGLAGRRVTVRVRFGDMAAITRATTLPGPIAETSAIYHLGASLVDAVIADRGAGRRVNLVGITVSQLSQAPHLQLELPLVPDDGMVHPGSDAHRRQRDLDAAVDRARDRFGRSAIRRAATLGDGPEQRSPDLDGDH